MVHECERRNHSGGGLGHGQRRRGSADTGSSVGVVSEPSFSSQGVLLGNLVLRSEASERDLRKVSGYVWEPSSTRNSSDEDRSMCTCVQLWRFFVRYDSTLSRSPPRCLPKTRGEDLQQVARTRRFPADRRGVRLCAAALARNSQRCRATAKEIRDSSTDQSCYTARG